MLSERALQRTVNLKPRMRNHLPFRPVCAGVRGVLVTLNMRIVVFPLARKALNPLSIDVSTST